MKCEAINAHSQEFCVKLMCKTLGLHYSAFYRWKRQERAREERRERELKYIYLIETIFQESDRTYGYRQIKKELEESGTDISEYRVRRIMRESGFYPETTTKYKPNYSRKGDGTYYKNLVKQDFAPKAFDKIWAGDITYIKTHGGWVYLAVVMDLFNREIIGYSISKKINTELVKAALGNAISCHRDYENLIFHSDRGCQYSSKGYQKMLEENNITGSMSRAGCPYDNSCVESFFATLKKERVFRREYVTMEDVRQDLFMYIELFYNRKRRHSVLGYQSPIAYRRKYDALKSA